MRRWHRSSTAWRTWVLLGGTLLSGCRQGTEREATVVYATGADLEGANPITTVHPLSRQVQRYVLLVTLVRFDSLLKPVPYAARTWRWSSDRRSVTLSLDRTLRWHDGVPTTAADVAFTYSAAIDPASGSPRAADLASVERVSAVGDTAVRFDFRWPQAELPTVFAELALAPAHLLASVPRADLRRAAYNTAPVGNGPFRFVRRDAGHRWVFERNPDFPESMGGPPQLQRLVVTLVDEPTTKFAGLVAGDLDVAGVSPTMAATVSADPTLRVVSYPVLFSNVIVFNASRPPFDDVRVRRAMDALIDRQRLVDVALAGYGTPADGPFPSTHPFWAPASPLAAQAADSLLDAAGYTRVGSAIRARGASRLTFELLTVGSGDNTVEQLVQGDLRRHGIEMQIRQLELGAFLAQARAKDKTFDALITGVPGDLAMAYLRGMFASSLRGGGLDYAGFHTPTLDSTFAEIQRRTDEAGQRRAWAALQNVLRAEVPVAWLYHSRGVQGVARSLDHVDMDLRGEMVSVTRWSRHANHTAQRASVP
ncbi:MAG: peptide ABC transporter substrate-binding protein [Gemmatimonadaceae bacterium]